MSLDNKERARMILTVKKVDEVTEVSLSENRERWHLRGGASSQAYRWWPIEPSEEALTAALSRLTIKLKERRCSPLRDVRLTIDRHREYRGVARFLGPG